MSLLTEIDGWTPVVDTLVKEHGLVTAAVFGAVWRYCQMKDKVCRASLEVIGERLKLDKATVMRHIKILCDYGYLEDQTPNRRNAPHIYADTGKVEIIGSIRATPALESHTKRGQTVAENNSYIMEETETVAENNSLDQTVAECNATVAECNATVAECNATVAENQLKRVSKKPSKKESIISSGKKPKTPRQPTEKELASRAMFAALVALCQFDPEMITDDLRGALNQAEKGMRDRGYSPADIEAFGAWWYANDWRGQKGQPPTLPQIRTTWGQFKNRDKPKGAQPNGHETSRYKTPTIDAEAYRHLEAQNSGAVDPGGTSRAGPPASRDRPA